MSGRVGEGGGPVTGWALILTGRGVVGRLRYALWGLGLMALKWNVDRLLLGLWDGLGGGLSGVELWKLYLWQSLPTGGDRAGLGAMLAVSLPFLYLGIVLTLGRLRSARLSPYWVLLFFVPAVKLLFFGLLCALPARRVPVAGTFEVEGSPAVPPRWLPASSWGAAWLAVAVSGGLAAVFTWIGTHYLNDYGWALFVGTPFVLGFVASSIYAAGRKASLMECLWVTWGALLAGGIVLLGFAFEGVICLVMAAPLAGIIASVGAVTAWSIRRTWDDSQNWAGPSCLVVALLPTMMGLERFAPPPSPVRPVSTVVEVDAPPEAVWRHVVTFSELPPPTEWMFRLGLAYPIRAEMRGSGVGAVRHCHFSTGAFVEPIEVWQEPERLAFRVESNPAPMQEWTPYRHVHPPHLDGHFLSRKGEFRLERLAGGRTRLTGTTWYEHRLWPDVYWRRWSDAIIHTIHGRVLGHVKALAEVGVAGGGATAHPAGKGSTEAAVAMGSRWELLVDDRLVERLNGCVMKLHTPREANVALRFDAPWEGAFSAYVTVLKDADRYRCYYRGNPVSGRDGSDTEVTCYAESRDGVVFTKPALGLFEVGGTRSNNVVIAGQAPFSHNFSPFLDARPGVPVEERFKALAGTSELGLYGFASADGVRWRRIRDQALMTQGAFDSQNVAFWSEAEGCYVLYLRTWSGGGFSGFRTISRSTSKDFIQWTEPVEMTFGDVPREHLYTSQTHPYFRAPHLYVAMPMRFMPGRQVLTAEQARLLGVDPGYAGDVAEAVFMTSRGGNRYTRTFMEGFIRPGPDPGNWASRAGLTALGVVPTGKAEMSLYKQAHYAQPSCHLVRYTLRTDGFVSVNAPYRGGEFLTRPLTFSGGELRVNFATGASGGVRVAIEDAEGLPLPGYGLEEAVEMVGDEIERVVRWKSGRSVEGLAGRTVRLRFVMRDADVWAFGVR